MFSEPQRFHKKTRCKTVLYSITSPTPVNTHSLLIVFSLNSDHYILHPLQSGLEQIGHWKCFEFVIIWIFFFIACHFSSSRHDWIYIVKCDQFFLRVWWMGDRDHKLSWSQIHHLHPHSYTNDGGTSKDQWSVGWTQLRIRRWSMEHETHSKKTRGKKRYQILVFQIHRRHWPNCFTRPLEESRSVRTTMNKNLKIMKSANSIRHFVCR